MRRRRSGVAAGLGDEGGNRGEEMGAMRGEPPIGRYLGVDDPAVGRRRGEDGRERTPDPFVPDLVSKTER